MGSLKQIKWGIIGVGDVCEVKSGPAFNKVQKSELVAVMRRDLSKAKDYAERHQVPEYYDDAEKIIHHSAINAVYIATPPAFHEQYAIEAMKAGKAVYIEKPVTLNADSCLRILEASKKIGAKVSVAHYRRALPNFNKIKQLIIENSIGEVRLINIRTLQSVNNQLISQASNWRMTPDLSGGGLFHDLAPHQMDIVYWIFGTPEKFYGYSLNQGKLYNAPDLTSLNAVFAKNIFLNGIWSFNVDNAAEEEICEIIGSKGKISFAFFRKPEIYLCSQKGTEVFSFNYPENIQLPMIEKVVNYFLEKEQNPCTLDDALVTMKIMDKTLSEWER